MLARPNSDEAESIKQLLHGNSFYHDNFKNWLSKSRAGLVLTMTNPQTDTNFMFRLSGAVNVLDALLKELETKK